LAGLPLKGVDQNRIWLAIVALAGDLQGWSGVLAVGVHEIRRQEPKKQRMHFYTVPVTIARTARRVVVHAKNTAHFAQYIVAGLNRLGSSPGPEPE
jgi:hypothetical protein